MRSYTVKGNIDPSVQIYRHTQILLLFYADFLDNFAFHSKRAGFAKEKYKSFIAIYELYKDYL